MKEFLRNANNMRHTAVVDDDFPEMMHRFDSDLDYYTKNIPTIVCLCGSTKFKEAYQKANWEETSKGNIVLSVGCYMHSSDNPFEVTPEIKIRIDQLHKRKIDLCDEVLVLNVGGYIGESTKSEIEYAKSREKKIRYLES